MGDWIVRPQLRVIEQGDRSVHIKPKPMAVLQCLAAADGEAVSRNELFDAVWPGGEVTDDTLTKCIGELRKAFGDSARDSAVIKTIPKFGFHLTLPVLPLEETDGWENPPVSAAGLPDHKQNRARRLAAVVVAMALFLAITLVLQSPRKLLTGSITSPGLKEGTDHSQQSAQRRAGIAVLPFVNMSSDPENEYFSHGVSEEILNALAADGRLPVIARTSSFQFDKEGVDIKKVGQLLNVSHVLEGSVRKSNGQVRVSAQLIDTTTGMHVWADVYQRNLSDILKVQHDITQQVVEQVNYALGLSQPLDPPGVELAITRQTDSIAAYDFYLRGTHLLARDAPISVQRAEAYFDQAIALDDDYADAWAGKGRALHMRGLTGGGHPDIPAEVFSQAIAAYRRALEIQPSHSVAIGWLGVALMQNDFRWEEGLELIRQSIEINPNNAAMVSRYAARLERLKLEGAAKFMQRALELDPFGVVPNVYRSSLMQQEGRYLDAADTAEINLVGNREGYKANFHAALLNMGAAGTLVDDPRTRDARLDSAESQIHMARRVAHPVDFSLDYIEMWVVAIRENTRLPWREILDRAKKERLNGLMLFAFYYPWEDASMMVEAIDLAIEQRDPEVWLLFGPKPPKLPEEDWHRMREITGITRFEAQR